MPPPQMVYFGRPSRQLTAARGPDGCFGKPSVLRTEGALDPIGGILDRSKVHIPTLPPTEPRRAIQTEDYWGLRQQIEKQEVPGCLTVKLDGEDVFIFVDPDRGPRWGKKPDDYVKVKDVCKPPMCHAQASWEFMSIDEKQKFLVVLAKKFRAFGFTGKGVKASGEDEEDESANMTQEEIEAFVKEVTQRRCEAEWMKPPKTWETVTVNSVTAGYRKRCPGMFYNMEFPWTEAMLMEFGPDWLTKAFHLSGVIDKDNRVTKIIPEKKIKISTGNNGGKFLFDVKYAKKRPGLHGRLFAKIPFSMEGPTRSDRLSSSVNKQPQEYYEINTSRLLEAILPVKTPRYYYGDISNDSTNWILITEAIAFVDPDPLNFGVPQKRRKRLPAMYIEGPYDKCMDHTLRGKPLNYYILLLKTGAKIAGYHKSGRLGPEELLRVNFGDMADKPAAFFGLSIHMPSGDDPRTVKPKIDTALPFLHDTGRVLFPDYVTEEWCNGKLKTLMMNMNAYSGEIMYWKHANQDYVALTHGNLNVDNAYFWWNAESEPKRECGVFDWGNMGSMSLGHKLWWWLYCMDFENFRDNLDQYMQTFVDAYAEHGGPMLDKDLLRWMVIMTSLEQMLQLLYAVPQIFKMCPKSEWPSIEHRYDYRISENIDGKSTLRLYLHVLNSIMRIIEEMEGAQAFDRWVKEVWVGQFNMSPKPDEAVQGQLKIGPGL